MTELWRQEMYANELYHFGIMGMKWGVRRYQNYDGSLTSAGMKRYNASKESYDKADSRYKKAKADLKSARRNDNYEETVKKKGELTNARLNRKIAKAKLQKDYHHLKQDKLADQGKELYSKGKTITGNRKIAEALGTVGSMSIMLASTGIGPAFVNGSYKTKKNVRKALYAVGATTIAAGTIKNIIDEDSNRKLRAYYSHSSKY